MRQFWFLIVPCACLFAVSSCEESHEAIVDPDDPDSLEVQRSRELVQLDSILFELAGSDPALPDTDLSHLAFLGNAQVVGMGEATHGTREFFQMKHRLLKYLVEHHGFRIFAMEADAGESFYIDRYVTEGIGDLDTLVRKTMLYGVWRNAEVKSLIEWMRTYNLGKPKSVQLRYVGIECQYFPYHPAIIEEYVGKAFVSALPLVKPTLDIIRALGRVPGETQTQYGKLSLQQKNEIADSLASLLKFFEDNKSAFVSGSSDDEYRTVHYLVANLKPTHEMNYAVVNGLRNWGIRDEEMAKNVERVVDLYAPGLKVAVWAHNVHVSNVAAGFPSYTPVMGYKLRQSLGSAYQIVGFSFSRGTFMASTITGNVVGAFEVQTYAGPPPVGSVNRTLDSARVANYSIRTADIAASSPLGVLFGGASPMINLGSGYSGTVENVFFVGFPQRTAFDVIINFNVSSAATYLPRITGAGRVPSIDGHASLPY